MRDLGNSSEFIKNVSLAQRLALKNVGGVTTNLHPVTVSIELLSNFPMANGSQR